MLGHAELVFSHCLGDSMESASFDVMAHKVHFECHTTNARISGYGLFAFTSGVLAGQCLWEGEYGYP